MKTCEHCEEEIQETFKFCPHCGSEQGLITWDWKALPPWGEINERLKPFGLKIEEVETQSDEHAIRLISIE